jgi:hypothetical protein
MKTAAILLAGVSLTGTIFGQACDRACLEGFVDKYMDALIAHDPKLVPLAKTLKNTENGQRLEPGDGFWRTATAKGAYRLFVDDPQAGQVAFLGTMKEANIPVSVAIRLKIASQQISEIETFVVRTGINGTNGAPELEKLGKPRAAFLETVPAAQRVSREELIKTANMYFSGLEKNDGKGNYPFADDCDRLEDGQQTTNNPNFRTGSGFGTGAPAGGRGAGKQAPAPPPPPPADGPQINPAAMSCKAAFESGYFHFVTRIRDRRFVVVDVERGLVYSFVFFDHAAGKNRTFKLADGREISAGPNRPWTWEIAEMFKMQGGKIHQVEALLEQVPYGMGSGWGN